MQEFATVVQDELQNSYQRTTPRGGESEDPEQPTLPVLADGTGTPCAEDTDCSEFDAALCLSADQGGFCTIEGCAAGGCGEPYVCCSDCSAEAAALLPFDDSACIPSTLADPLAAAAGCSCN